jgi:hypothetical protein
MKKFILTTLTLFAAGLLLTVPAQEKEVKTGWSFGVLPSVTYNTDNGFQYGAFGDVYQYGDGSTYPDPLHKISWEASHFTKGKTRLYLSYDSKYLIPNMRVNASITFVNDPMYSFWGFNGPAALTHSSWSANKDVTPSINYYGMSRKMYRGLLNVQGHLTEHLNWAAGFNIWKWEFGDMRESEKNENRYSVENTLYRDYQAIGAIREDEADGGWATEMNLGLVYDTRDIEAAPNRGVWVDAYLNGDPFRKYLKACVYFRNYFDIPIHIPAGDPVFAYRLAWQQTIAGEVPFYMIQNVPLLVQRNMISEGFGSAGTIRGIRENRILAEGFAWANLELRIKLVSFKLFNQYFYIAVNPFFDAGVITKPYRADAFGLSTSMPVTPSGKRMNQLYDETRVGDIVYSGGGGLKIAMNQNFVVSAEVAHCFYTPLNTGLWINIGTNYQF